MNTEPENKKVDSDSPNISDKKKLTKHEIFSQTISPLITSLLVGFFGIFNLILTTQNSAKIEDNKNRLQEIQNQFKRNKIFNDKLHESLNDFVGKNDRAKLSFISLYQLAETVENKCIVFAIAYSSDNEKLFPIADQFLQSDVLQSDKCFYLAKVVLLSKYNNKKQESDETTEGKDSIKSGPESTALAKLTKLDTTDSNEKSNDWMFLGIKNEQGKLEQPTIKTNELPKKGSEYVVLTQVNLRDKKYDKETGLGNVTGIINQGSTIKIIEYEIIQNNSGINTIWANIQLIKKK
jgi:hypothetical protein